MVRCAAPGCEAYLAHIARRDGLERATTKLQCELAQVFLSRHTSGRTECNVMGDERKVWVAEGNEIGKITASLISSDSDREVYTVLEQPVRALGGCLDPRTAPNNLKCGSGSQPCLAAHSFKPSPSNAPLRHLRGCLPGCQK